MASFFLSADLIFTSKVTGISREHGWDLAVISSAEMLVQEAKQGTDLILIDLSLPSLNLESLVSQLQRLESPPENIIAFGPHVHQKILENATSSGCDKVYTKGQFHQEMPAILEHYLGKSQNKAD